MRGLIAAIHVGLLDMRGDLRRFVLLIACLAVGTALIAGVSSVGASIRQAVEEDAALLMGGDVEISRTDRVATATELEQLRAFGEVTSVVDTNVRARANDKDAFVDLISIGPGYPLLGQIGSPALAPGDSAYELLGLRDATFGALVNPLMLDQLGLAVGDQIELGGTLLDVRGVLNGVPDGAVRGFRLGLPVLITTDALAVLSDRTSPLPGLGTYFRYKVLLDKLAPEAGRAAIGEQFGKSGWTVRSARESLGPMVHYYDLFLRFLVIVGLASLLIGGVSVWTSISAYVAERSNVVAVLRSMGATRARVFIHFFAQIAALTAIGVGIGVAVGAGVAQLALPVVGRAVGIALPAGMHVLPLLVAAGIGAVTAFAFSYVPLQQAMSIQPVSLFRAKGLAAPPVDWGALLRSLSVIPLILSGVAFVWLATVMTDDFMLVAAFTLVGAIAVVVFRMSITAVRRLLARSPEPSNHLIRYALRGISGHGSGAPSVVVSVGMALAMLVVVLVLQVNLGNEYLGASVFDAPTLVASDLFEDEVATIETMQAEGDDIAAFTTTPMLRGQLLQINGNPVTAEQARGSEALFLLSGEVPLTYRQALPASSKVVEGNWWADGYAGPPLLSLHESLRSGLGLKLGDRLTFDIFGDQITAEISNFREYSWQGGIDFLATFSPNVLEDYPSTLLAAVTAVRGKEQALEAHLATALPDVRFIAIGQTLELITSALTQLSLATSLVGGLAVGNGLLVLIGSLAAGQQQRQADAVINKVLGASRLEIVAVTVLQYALISLFAAVIAMALGVALARILTGVLLDVEFTVSVPVVLGVSACAVLLTALLGALSIRRALSSRPALLLRAMGNG
ncbi:MAG: FtsX-like permease family protein [Devosia sp.]|uniref:ABC transporter permease n=1 Tax=Devosia sp. TaxID=1871048 RepID=UPI001AC73ACE|nr:FtsX-like permease family protein [Devosia sp.]MBN9316760.1 FtsX-like permease family protein [Devosia sp.]